MMKRTRIYIKFSWLFKYYKYVVSENYWFFSPLKKKIISLEQHNEDNVNQWFLSIRFWTMVKNRAHYTAQELILSFSKETKTKPFHVRYPQQTFRKYNKNKFVHSSTEKLYIRLYAEFTLIVQTYYQKKFKFWSLSRAKETIVFLCVLTHCYYDNYCGKWA